MERKAAAADPIRVHGETHAQPAPTLEPPLSPAPEPTPLPVPVPEPRPETEPEPLPPAALGGRPHRISLRLDTGERLEVARHGSEAAARSEATELMRYLRDGRGDWPFVAGRFVRPERIVSVDVD